MPEAARLGDPVGHTRSMGWMIAGIIAGAVLGAALVAVTGGAALVVVAAIAAGAAAGGGIGQLLATMSWAPVDISGSLIKGSANVFTNGRPAVFAHLCLGACSQHGYPPQVVAEGSGTVLINGWPAARKGDHLTCDAKIAEGAGNVIIGGPTAQTDAISPEIPEWVNWTLLAVGFAAAVVLAGPIVAIVGTAGGFAGGAGGNWLGGKIFGEGSDGQKWMMLGGSVLGGVAGAKGGGWLAGRVIPNPSTGLQAFAKGGVPAMENFNAAAAKSALPEETLSTEAEGRSPSCVEKCGDPVDVAAGAFIEWRTDIFIPGALPIEWRRSYASNRERQPGFFGPRWLDNWSVSLHRAGPNATTIDYRDADGVVFTFDTPSDELNVTHLRAPALALRGTRAEPVLRDRSRGMATHFVWHGNRARLAAYSDASGNRCDFVYADDDRGVPRLVALKHSDGWRLQLGWTSEHISSVWLHEPDRAPVELVRYRHDERGRVVHSASLESGRLYYRYGDDDRIVGWGDDSATHVRIAYNEQGRVASVDTPDGLHSGRFEYNLDVRKTFVWEVGSDQPLDPKTCTVFSYNADLLVTNKRDPLGNETRTEWDEHHHVVAVTDALGRTSRNAYDDTGRLAEIIDPQGRSGAFQYDDEGRLLVATDPYGRQFSQTYDECGRLASKAAPDGRETGYTYDARGRLQTVQGAAGTVRYHYDAQHRPCGRTAANGAHESWQQNRVGQLAWHTNAIGATTTFDHDVAGHPDEPAVEPPRAGAHLKPRRIVRADGSAVDQRYTQEGQLTEQTDADGHTRRWEWGAYDLLTEKVDATGHSTRYHYGTGGRLTEIVNAAGQSWHWRRDAAGRLCEQIDYAGRRTRWERDALGRPLVRWQPDATPWRYEWDERDRLRAIRAPDVRHEYCYDNRDQLIEATVWRGDRLDSQLEIEYDEMGRLTAETHRCGEDASPRRIAYRYDEQGRLAGRDGPLGETHYRFDALGLLRELHTAHGALHIARDAGGREIERASIPLAPNVPTPGQSLREHFRLEQQHDKLGHLIHQQSGDVLARSYHWQHDRLVGVDDERFGSVRWQLDARDQIVEAEFGGPHRVGDDEAHLADGLRSADQRVHQRREKFAYDAVGNVSSIDGAPLRYEGDMVVEGGHNRYAWDRCGRMVRRTEERNGFRPRTWHYEWDSFNRLLAVTTPEGQRWRYVYDAFGRRRAKRCEAPSPKGNGRRPVLRQAEYLWDGPTVAAQWKIFADGTSEAPNEQVQEWHYDGGFTPLALVQQRNGQAQLLHVVSDLNGAPRELLSGEGELVWTAQLDTWGKLARCHVKDGDRANMLEFAPGYRPAANDPVVDVDLRFANQWADEESGLYYNLNRYYDPAIGQYASQDPLGPAGGIRTHGYVHNPLTWVDPSGLAGCPEDQITVYRGTDNANEVFVHKDSGGAILSDSGREAYMGTRLNGGTVDESLAAARQASEKADAAQLATWGSREDYVQAHGEFGQEITQFGPRSMVSFTTDPAVTSTFGQNVLSAKVPQSSVIPQTIPNSTESEVMVVHGIFP
jgi:RHS repeat-associated protein